MAMEKAEEELERRSKFLNSLILKKKSVEEKQQNEHLNVSVRASDMSFSLQNHAFKCARENLDAMACGKLDSKRLALALKKGPPETASIPSRGSKDRIYSTSSRIHFVGFQWEFDSTYGPAWHCIVGTSFGSYVTHSIGGFLYFSIDKVYVLLFRTVVEPLDH
ncbi:dynein light chain 1, cytoplasmic isoform X1 [Capsicum annuum]|uniref:dynein light chain 1, cytoplasmic isoform X1 n=1 Tax=Capsicum annuum TaxID=4072 RepID=UPI0007BFBDD8|nr:dynein light chain 1, cytoplasmic isoform X1 [Capsicum annuum]